MKEADVKREQEIRQIQMMLDQWHKMQMDIEISKEVAKKKLNDKIMSFAEKQTRLTETRGTRGQVTSSVRAVSKRGNQSFKF